MADEALRPAYLLLGSDRPKIRRALARLRGRFAPESIESHSADTTTGEDAAAACNALGLFGPAGAKLVVVDGVDRWRAEDVDAVAAYLANPSEGGVLALVADAALKHDALVKACERAGQVLRFDVPKPRDPSVWVRSEFERLGVAADADAARALVEAVGDDIPELAEEIQKIATWAGDDPVGRREVEDLAAPSGDMFIWTLTDAWGERNTAAALAACETLLERRIREPFGIAVALASYVGRVGAAQALSEEGLNTAEIAKRLRIKDYPARKAVGHAKNFTRDELDAALIRLSELDQALKGASRLSPELELERTLVEITGTREPAAVGT